MLRERQRDQRAAGKTPERIGLIGPVKLAGAGGVALRQVFTQAVVMADGGQVGVVHCVSVESDSLEPRRAQRARCRTE